MQLVSNHSKANDCDCRCYKKLTKVNQIDMNEKKRGCTKFASFTKDMVEWTVCPKSLLIWYHNTQVELDRNGIHCFSFISFSLASLIEQVYSHHA